MALKDIVKGICDITRCKYDVYTKDRTDELLNTKANVNDTYNKGKMDEALTEKLNKSDFAVITGTMEVGANNTGTADHPYPDGFTVWNTYVMTQLAKPIGSQGVYQTGQVVSTTDGNGALTLMGAQTNPKVTLREDGIRIACVNPNSDGAFIFDYKIMILKM